MPFGATSVRDRPLRSVFNAAPEMTPLQSKKTSRLLIHKQPVAQAEENEEPVTQAEENQPESKISRSKKASRANKSGKAKTADTTVPETPSRRCIARVLPGAAPP